jgi:hypothetical protein
VTTPRLESAPHLSRNVARGFASCLLLVTFALLAAFPTEAQQELSPVPDLPSQQAFAENAADNPRETTTAGPERPDAPSRLPQQARRMTLGERLRIYRHSIFNRDSVFGPAVGAALGQASNEPPEWGQGASGYGTRLASGYGRLVINRTIRFGVAAIDHEDPRFTYSNEDGFWRRFRYASVHFVMAPTDTGNLMPAYSRFAGTYGAAFIANAWYPESRANSGHALMRGSTALAGAYAWNVFREFWPDIKKAIHHPKTEQDDVPPRDPNH